MQTQYIDSVNSTSKATSLESVLQAMAHWRMNKSKYGAIIPDKLWLQIFQLEQAYPPEKIRQVFSISKNNYLHKHAELLQDKGAPTQVKQGQGGQRHKQESDFHAPQHGSVPSVFSEAIISEETMQSSLPDSTPRLTKADIRSLKKPDPHPSTFLDLSTIVVEFIRADGQRMKIHTTKQSFKELIDVFFEAGETSA